MSTRHELLNWLLSSKSDVLLYDGEHRVRSLALTLSELYSSYQLGHTASREPLHTLPHFATQNMRKYPLVQQALTRMQEIVNETRNLIDLFVLHGSYADNTFQPGWSDVDTFAVVKNSTILDTDSFLFLRERFVHLEEIYKTLCPLQHHGIICVSSVDLLSYDNHFLPPVVLNDSLAFYQSSSPLFFLPPNGYRSTALSSINNRIRYMEDALVDGFYKHHPYKGIPLDVQNPHKCMYQLFCFMGYIMTLPSYFYDAIDRPCLKSQSFHAIKNDFPLLDFTILEVFSKVRDLWPQYEGFTYVPNLVPDWVLSVLPNEWFQLSLELTKLLQTRALKIINESS